MKRRVTLRKESESDTATIKKEIQRVVREIVIARDGGCIFGGGGQFAPYRSESLYSITPTTDHKAPPCNGYAKDGHLILQADHLISRGNSATYADTRLIVCVCKGHHGWKSVGSNLRKQQYDAIVRQLISPERVALWDKMEAAQHQGFRPGQQKINWAVELAVLKQELAGMNVFSHVGGEGTGIKYDIVTQL